MKDKQVQVRNETCKLIIVGESDVGKSSLLSRYFDLRYEDKKEETLGIDFRSKLHEVNEKKVHLQVWDTSAEERFRKIALGYYRATNGIIVVYDATNRHSFTQLSQWFYEIKRFTTEKVQVLLVANKSDLRGQLQVESEEGREFAEKMGVGFVEASAKLNWNVNHTFDTIINAIQDKSKNHHKDSAHNNGNEERIEISFLKPRNRSSCTIM